MDIKFSSDWKQFPSYDDLETDSKFSTLILSVKSQYSDPILNSLVKSLNEKNYITKSKLIKGTTISVNIFQGSEKVGTIESHYVWLLGNLSSFLYEDVKKLLKTDFSYFGKTIGRVYHSDTETKLEENFSIRSRSGIPKDDEELIPYTFFFLYEKDVLIGKTLVKYLNPEMGEYEPTIMLMEISEEKQDDGIKFLKFIEDHLKQNGFTKLWVLDIQNDVFWTNAGFKIDENQAVKYLNL